MNRAEEFKKALTQLREYVLMFKNMGRISKDEEKVLLSKLNTMDAYAKSQEGQWVIVEDRLPTVANVIVNYAFGVGEAKFVKGKFCLTSDWTQELPGVTHWMPLPEPPKTKDNE